MVERGAPEGKDQNRHGALTALVPERQLIVG